MDYSHKLQLAQQAYKEIMDVIQIWESKFPAFRFCAHWDGCITIEDELFHEHQLRHEEK